MAAALENSGAPVDAGDCPNVVTTGNLERAANALNENVLASIVSDGFAVDDGSELGVACFGSIVGVVAGEMSSYLGKPLVAAGFDCWSSDLLDVCCRVGVVVSACLVASIG